MTTPKNQSHWTVTEADQILAEGDASGPTNRECALSVIDSALDGETYTVAPADEWSNAYTATLPNGRVLHAS